MRGIPGILEIDEERGVIYFHTTEKKECERRNSTTVLRIQGLPTPVPNDQQLDITIRLATPSGTSWGEEAKYLAMFDAYEQPIKDSLIGLYRCNLAENMSPAEAIKDVLHKFLEVCGEGNGDGGES